MVVKVVTEKSPLVIDELARWADDLRRSTWCLLSNRANPFRHLFSSVTTAFVFDLINFFQRPVPAEGREEGEVDIAEAKDDLRRQENDPLRMGTGAGCVGGLSGRGDGKPASIAERDELDE